MTKTWFKASTAASGAAIAGMMLLCAPAMSADVAPEGRKIGYVITEYRWGIYQTKDAKAECPTGVNDLGPREQFKLQFPADGTKRTVVDTQLLRESETWWPKVSEKDRFPFHEAGGSVAIGLDLDGKTKPTDFKSPEGKPGIDNQMFRVLGCIVNFRDGSSVQNFEDIYHKKMMINRMMIVLTDVDSLTNDDDITITTYRGLDPMVADAAGQDFFPGGTERLDLRWGKEFIHSAKGKIVNGVLTTQGLDFYLPHEIAYMSAAYYWLRDARFELNLTPGHAQGIVGGYADIDHFYRGRNREWSTHHLSYGQEVMASEYRALKRNADAYPDPQTGENTAISAAFRVKMAQVRIIPDIPPTAKVAANTTGKE